MDWKEFYRHHRDRPMQELQVCSPWQTLLAQQVVVEGKNQDVLEAGSGYGQTGNLVTRLGARVTLLDLHGEPLLIARRIFSQTGLACRVVQGDLLNLPFADGAFAVVFNAGVLEHFEFADRCRILTEMVRCAQPQGRVIVAVPNHCSRPYRYSYLYRKKKDQWPYPDEIPIRDFSREIEKTGLDVKQRIQTLDRTTAYHFLRRHQRILFKMLALFRPHQGYLRVITLTRKAPGRGHES